MKHRMMAVWLPAAIFAINIMIGISFQKYDDFSYLWRDTGCVVRTIGSVAVLSVLFALMLWGLYIIMGKVSCNTSWRITPWKITIVSFFVFGLCYAPYLLAYYPGSISFDSICQISAYYGYLELTNHHPFLSTLLMSICMKLGTMIRNNNLGVFLYVAFQTIVLSFAFAYTIGRMVKWKLPKIPVLITGVYYAVMPIWGGYSQLVIKDTLYTAVIVLFVAQFLDLLAERKDPKDLGRKIAALAVTGIFVSLLRNNGIYVVVPCFVGGLILVWKEKQRNCWLYGTLLCVGFYLIWGNIVLPMANVKDGSVREALSVPFQQTARYIKEYSDEVTKQEYEAINQILDYDRLGKNYVSYISDPVKDTYKEPQNEFSALKDYFKHWFFMFFKHPSVYFEATVANSYYYYCANIVGSFEPIYVNFIYYGGLTEKFNLKMTEKTAHMREWIDQYVKDFQEVPIIKYLFGQGFYTYILIGLIGFLYYAGKKEWVVGLIPNILGVLICIASPVNGSYRYFLPVMACTAISIMFCLLNDN